MTPEGIGVPEPAPPPRVTAATGDARVARNGGSGGVIVLAAYRPDPDLFRIQLESIRDQTRTDWRCLVGADGDREPIRSLVETIVGDDPRFEVVGWDDNVGCYRNFERLLRCVEGDVAWVALSDQDDRWYPNKLERLVPLLEDSILVAGGYRVITDGSAHVPAALHHSLTVEGLMAQNPLPGATCVFRRELLSVCLPFPDDVSLTAAHDHWIALCAAAVDRCSVSPQLFQDYIQHGGNAIGYEGQNRPWRAFSRRIGWVAHRLKRPGRLLAEAEALSFGWRRAMAAALLPRITDGRTGGGAHGAEVFAGRNVLPAMRSVLTSARRGDIGTTTLASFVLGLPGAAWPRRELKS